MSSDNAKRLRAIMQFFGISVSAIARATGKSQTYISRTLSPNDVLAGSSSFWSCLEKEIGLLVKDHRRNQIFTIVPVEFSKAEELQKYAAKISKIT